MNYDKLDAEYWKAQIERISEIRGKIASRKQVVFDGLVVPEEADLTIGTGRRLSLAIMFIDLCRSSSRPAEVLGEQDLLVRIYDLYFTEMIRIAEEYGGTVEKNTGDGLMAYYEDEEVEVPDNCCKRALTCAMTMMYTTANAINPILQATPTDIIHFRVGIDYGHTTIAQLGAAKRFGNRVAVGNTPNVASKMLDGVGDDQIILGENVVNRIPVGWRQWCELYKSDTGYTYTYSGKPYRFFRYNSRWSRPL